jgi:hypothetical protein
VSFGRRTLVALSRALSDINHAPLGTLFFEYRLEARDPGGGMNQRALEFVKALEDSFPADEVDRICLEIATRVIRERPLGHNTQYLLAALKLEGFEYEDGRLIPATPGAVNIATEISILESELQHRQYNVASAHYRQAVDSFVDGRCEASNGQIRAFMEDLFVSLAQSNTGSTSQEPRAALDSLRDDSCIDSKQWNLFRGYWDDIQDNGPHRGLSDREEALFRLHMGTALARYLLSVLR